MSIEAVIVKEQYLDLTWGNLPFEAIYYLLFSTLEVRVPGSMGISNLLNPILNAFSNRDGGDKRDKNYGTKTKCGFFQNTFMRTSVSLQQ